MRNAVKKRNGKGGVWLRTIAGLSLLAALVLPLPLWAASPTLINLTTPSVPIDSIPANGPLMLLFSLKVTNPNATTLQNVSSTLNLSSGGTLASGETVTRKTGTLLAGTSNTVFWFVKYAAAGTISYSFTTTSLGEADVTLSSQTVSVLSSGSTASQKICAGYTPVFSGTAIVGNTITETFRVDFGNINNQVVALSVQGAANGTGYQGGILQFAGSTLEFYGAGTCAVPTTLIGTYTNILYLDRIAGNQFPDITNGNPFYGIVTYNWLVVGTGTTPVAAYVSANTGAPKYNSDFTPVGVPTPPATNSLALAKTASASLVPTGGTPTRLIEA
jgi:hypothetical protein